MTHAVPPPPERPATLGRRAVEVRDAAFGRTITIRPTMGHARPKIAAVLRDGDVMTCDAWPAPARWQPGDRVVIQVDARAPEDHERFMSYLADVAREAPAECSLAPFSSTPSGIAPLWCIAAARLTLPPSVRVEVRHDLLGIRLAQVALGFGGDTLSGPLQSDRKLPIAGVPRPDEATLEGLANLVRALGLTPDLKAEVLQ